MSRKGRSKKKSRSQVPGGHFQKKPAKAHSRGHGQRHAPRPASHESEKTGAVQANEKGFGFFIPDDESPDAFLPPHEMRTLVHGDTIRAKVFPDPWKPGRFNAKLVAVVKRASPTIVGTLLSQPSRLALQPDNPKIPVLIHLNHSRVAGKPGQKAVVRVTQWPGAGGPMEGQIEEILGFPNDPGVDMKSVIRKYQWPERFSQELENHAGSRPENPTEMDWAGRLDLQRVPILTIDGKDAKDFDDAISLEVLPNGHFRLGVHIADVSHYVGDGAPLDQEAQSRATSVYLPDRVLPMLPHSLSDGLCSLREGVPRLTMSAFLDYDHAGHLLKTDFAASVIQSARRGIYEEVQAFLDKTAPPEIRAKYENLEPTLRNMVKLSRLIRQSRADNGPLDFDFPEVKADVDAEGLPVNIRKVERLESHKIIEDFMIAANEAVATHLSRLNVPTLYRVHEPPTESDLEDLKNFLAAYSIPFRKLNLSTPQGLRALLASLKGEPLEPVVSMLTLRSLKLAAYSTKNLGHFGLALKSYCHFTSPIRRYPDLVVHRSLKHALQAHGHASKANYGKLALQCSTQERVAEKMERESQKMKQLKFMESRLNQVFDGAIRGLTPYGAYVELEPYGVEGFLPLANLLDDDYDFDPKAMVLRGRRGSRLTLGEPLRVKTLSVDTTFQRLLLQRIAAV